MRYIVYVDEIVKSEVIVEADSIESAKEKAIEAVWDGRNRLNRAQRGGVCLHHDSDTKAEGHLLQPEYQEGGEYYDKQVVE